MTQYARPDETLVDYANFGTDWTASTGGQLWTVLDDEIANDNQYISVDLGVQKVQAAVGVGLSDFSAPATLTDHIVKFRMKSTAPVGQIAALYLFPDNQTTFLGMLGNALASKQEYYEDNPLTTSWAEYTWTLSAAQMSAISSNYTSLAFGIYVADAGQTPTISLSWVEFQCPDAATDSRTTINTGPWVSEITWTSDLSWTNPSEATTTDGDPWDPWIPSEWSTPSDATDDDLDPWTPHGPSDWSSGPNWPKVPPSGWSNSGDTIDTVVTWEAGMPGPGAFSPWFRASNVTDSEWGVDFVLKVNDQFPDYVSDKQPLTVWDSPITGGI